MRNEDAHQWPPAPYGSPGWTDGSARAARARQDAPQAELREAARTPWYGRLGIVIAAFLAFPPAGLYLAWRHQRLLQRPLWVRMTAVGVTILWVFFFVAPRPDSGDGGAGSVPVLGEQVEVVERNGVDSVQLSDGRTAMAASPAVAATPLEVRDITTRPLMAPEFEPDWRLA